MASVQEHYQNILSEVYTWMYGGFEHGRNKYMQFFKENAFSPAGSGLAIDLGAGSGFQSIPLAELGYSVTAIDLNENLLNELRGNSQGLSIDVIQDDLMSFRRYCQEKVELVVCMTDTLVHLDSKDKVPRLFRDIFTSLEDNGRFVLTFRDKSVALEDLNRFIPVRSDNSTVFTCFLEYDEQETVKVHDLVYKKNNSGWDLNMGSYRKLRLSRNWVEDQLTTVGFKIDLSETDEDFVVLIARKCET